MEQASEKWVDRIQGSTAIEVGLFAENVAALCLEQDIDYSFTVCFPWDVKKWVDVPFVKHSPLLLMSIGKAKVYRRDFLPQRSSDQDLAASTNSCIWSRTLG